MQQIPGAHLSATSRMQPCSTSQLDRSEAQGADAATPPPLEIPFQGEKEIAKPHCQGADEIAKPAAHSAANSGAHTAARRPGHRPGEIANSTDHRATQSGARKPPLNSPVIPIPAGHKAEKEVRSVAPMFG